MDSPPTPKDENVDQNSKVIIFPMPLTPARWQEYTEIAHEFDGYKAYPNNLAELANQTIKKWRQDKSLPNELKLLRACLFYEARRARFIEGYAGEKDMPYLDALVFKIKANLGENLK